MRLRVYVHRLLRPDVKDVTYSAENTGVLGVVANKGGWVLLGLAYMHTYIHTSVG
jgi:hypothetical protein